MDRNKIKRQSPCLFPNYKWCGPGCSGPGKPLNDVDDCCRRHDLCLQKGYSSCDCDAQFLGCLRPKVNYHTEKGRIAALIYNAIKLKHFFECRL